MGVACSAIIFHPYIIDMRRRAIKAMNPSRVGR